MEGLLVSAFHNRMNPSLDPEANKSECLIAQMADTHFSPSDSLLCAFFTTASGFFFCELQRAIELWRKYRFLR
jgi:hypothetical protein